MDEQHPERMAVAVIQARMSSTRLPGKVLMDVGGRPLLAWLVERLKGAARVERTVLATSDKPADDPVAALGEELGLVVVRGSEADVLDRYRKAAEAVDARHVIRLTGDCPLLDPAILDALVDAYFDQEADYARTGQSFAEGADVEIFSRQALETAWNKARLPSEREHVTLYFDNHPEELRCHVLENPTQDGEYRITVDEPEDFELVKAVIEHFHSQGRTDFGIGEIKAFLDAHPEVKGLNAHIVRNEGLLISLDRESGQNGDA